MSTESSDSKSEWLHSAFDEWLEWRCDEGACAACRRNANGLFEPATEPKMPPEDCTCEGGCRCRYVLVPHPPKDEAIKPPV